jgi:hypothetical protein
MGSNSFFDSLDLALYHRDMLTRSSSIDHDAEAGQLVAHSCKGTLSIGAKLDTIEVFAYVVVQL